MAEKKNSEKKIEQARFFSKYPLNYRRAVLKIFRSYVSDPANSGVELDDIFQEFLSYANGDLEIVEGSTYESIRNITRGRNGVLKNKKLFLLMEKYVVEKCHHKLNKINNQTILSHLATSIDLFYESQIDTAKNAMGRHGNRKSKTFSDRNSWVLSDKRHNSIFKNYALKENVFYKIKTLQNDFNLDTDDEDYPFVNRECLLKHGKDLEDYYFYICSGDSNTRLMLFFNNNSKKEIAFGVHNIIERIFILKKLHSKAPFLGYLEITVDSDDFDKIGGNDFDVQRRLISLPMLMLPEGIIQHGNSTLYDHSIHNKISTYLIEEKDNSKVKYLEQTLTIIKHKIGLDNFSH